MGSLEDLLRECVVRVEGGPQPGTGFFVAPGRVVSCVHVVGTAGASLYVRLPSGNAVACDAPVLYCDRGRPIPELDGDYPDLALLDVDVSAHPCVAVDPDWPQLADGFQGYGFPSEGGSVVLTPLALTYSGKKGPDELPFIDLASATPVMPGMSGAPLFSIRTGGVCGIVVATRNASHAHGGLAVAWSALGPAADELLAASDHFHERDRRWAVAHSARRRHVVFGRARTVAHFTGRGVELATLRQRMQAADRTVITQAITGLGGVGKTQLAARYVQRCGEQYDVVAWVRAQDGGVADLAAFAATLGLAISDLAPEERAAEAVRWLECCDERWLLVLDNVTSLEQLEVCCPAGGNGRVLITSRNRDLEQLAPVLSIDVFGEDTAIEYLIARTGRSDERQAARALARALGGLPLALAHAGAYCAKTTSLANYRTLLDDLPPAELYNRSPEAFYRQTVASTWQPSIQQARAEASLAPSVLAMASCLAPDDIPLALFEALVDDSSDAHQRKQVIDAIGALDRYSLATVERETFTVHRLLQRVVRDSDATYHERAGRIALSALSTAVPTDPEIPDRWPAYERFLPHILALGEAFKGSISDAVELIALLNRASAYLLRAGGVQRAIDATTSILHHAERLLGAEHPATLTARASLAFSYWSAGRTSDAINLDQHVLADRERLLGATHPATLTVRANLACSYWSVGRSADAVWTFEQVLSHRARLLGADHPDTLTARANLATSYRSAGYTANAIGIRELVLADSERLLGAEHPDALTAHANLACAYWSAGRTADAINIEEQVLGDRERLLGATHPATLSARANLASSYRSAGRTTDARRMEEQVSTPPSDRFAPRTPPSWRTSQR